MWLPKVVRKRGFHKDYGLWLEGSKFLWFNNTIYVHPDEGGFWFFWTFIHEFLHWIAENLGLPFIVDDWIDFCSRLKLKKYVAILSVVEGNISESFLFGC